MVMTMLCGPSLLSGVATQHKLIKIDATYDR